MKILFNNSKEKTRGASSKQPKPSRPFEGKKLLPVAVLILVSLLLLAVAEVVVTLKSQPIERVAVNGEFIHVNEQSIARQVEPFLNDGFFMLDLSAIKQQLVAQPWVLDAKIERHWPGEIIITVKEQTAIARWGDKAYLNHRGELFSPKVKALRASELPLLRGPQNSSEQLMNHFRQLSEVLVPRGLALQQLVLNDRGNWSLQLTNGIAINLGGSEVMAKMRRLLSSHEQGLAAYFEKIKTIDMRYSNGFAVAWKEQQS